MSRNLLLLLGLTSLLPLAVEAPPDSNTSYPGGARFRVSGGVGYYAFIARGCEGQVVDKLPAHFRDASASYEQHLPGAPVSVGLRGGWLRDRIDTTSSLRFPTVPAGQTIPNRYLNLFVDFDPGTAALGLGYVFHDREFITAGEHAREVSEHPLNDLSFHARIGRADDQHFLVQWMESEPLYSGGGYLTLGIGDATRSRKFRGFAGLGAGGPYEGAALMGRASYELGAGTLIHAAGRIGPAGDDAAWGLSLGLELYLPASALRSRR